MHEIIFNQGYFQHDNYFFIYNHSLKNNPITQKVNGVHRKYQETQMTFVNKNGGNLPTNKI